MEFIVIAIPVLYCYILAASTCAYEKWPVPYDRSCTIRNSVWPLRHSSVIYSILLVGGLLYVNAEAGTLQTSRCIHSRSSHTCIYTQIFVRMVPRSFNQRNALWPHCYWNIAKMASENYTHLRDIIFIYGIVSVILRLAVLIFTCARLNSLDWIGLDWFSHPTFTNVNIQFCVLAKFSIILVFLKFFCRFIIHTQIIIYNGHGNHKCGDW